MKRRLVLKICLVFLVSGLFHGPTTGGVTSHFLHANQLSTLKPAKKPQQPKKPPQQPKKPGAAPAETPEPESPPKIPTDITLRIRLKFVASGTPRFTLWSFRAGEYKQTVLKQMRKVENEYLTDLTKGLDPTKQCWIRVDHQQLSGEAMLPQPTRTRQELSLDVSLYPTVRAEIKIDNYDTHRPSIISVGRSGDPERSLIPYPIDNSGQAIFVKGMDLDAENEIYVKGFRPIPIDIGEIQNGRLEKTIRLETSDETSKEGKGKSSGGNKGEDNTWEIVKFILAGIVLASLVVILSCGVYRLHRLRSEPSVPEIPSSPSRAQKAQPRTARTGSQYSPVMREPAEFIEPKMGRDSNVKIDNSNAYRPTEPQLLNVPLHLSEEGALQAYQSLIRRSALSRQPLTLDITLSDSLNKKGEQLKETMDPSSKFVLFTDGSEKGWLFPNPAPAVRETNVEQTWQLLFEGLTTDEFERKKDRLWPIKASRNNKGSKSLWNAQRQRCKFV